MIRKPGKYPENDWDDYNSVEWLEDVLLSGENQGNDKERLEYKK